MSDALDIIRQAYERMAERIPAARAAFNRPLTLAEKILVAHRADDFDTVPERRTSYVNFSLDRVAMQDATAQMALLQFMQAGRDRTAVPSTVHCDHLIRAQAGADEDLLQALEENNEVYAFLKNVSQKYGIGFWKPGAGIIHQVILENYAFPGCMMIGTDSHTPNAGGLGVVAIGVGGADAVDVMAGMPWELRWPGLIGIKLTGELNGWTSPKDVILKIAGILTVKGGTGCIVEYFGEGTKAISCTGKATITNMGAELGATTSVFPFDERMATYLDATERCDVAALARQYAEHLKADDGVAENPEDYYDQVIEIDLSTLEPYVVGPFTPDLARPISALKAEAAEKDYPEELKVCLIGSCTNSSYEDIGRAANVAQQALDKGLKATSDFLITPGSEQIRATIQRDGQLDTLTALGGKVLANACGPCIGQWKRLDTTGDEKNSIITSFNRNFARRNDGNAATLAFIGSPEIVTAMAIAGKLTFNPITDTIAGEGGPVKLDPPVADELPRNGFDQGVSGYIAPADDPGGVTVTVADDSNRLQLLTPFSAWAGGDLTGMLVLLKAVGKCTTDHISPAGPWLKFRGHLDNISDNMFIGANNAFAEGPGNGANVLSGEGEVNLSKIARDYKAKGYGWVSIGDENYGEGSSREHAAMCPRHLGAQLVIVRSFARIHETNLKKQGVLPLTFADPADYEKVQWDDRVAVKGLKELKPGTPLTVVLTHSDGSEDSFEGLHTMSEQQISWFQAGSALNKISAENA
jgi:aconitate hydratase